MAKKRKSPLHPSGRPHLSECLLRTAYEMGWDVAQYWCTCDDRSPDWSNN